MKFDKVEDEKGLFCFQVPSLECDTDGQHPHISQCYVQHALNQQTATSPPLPPPSSPPPSSPPSQNQTQKTRRKFTNQKINPLYGLNIGLHCLGFITAITEIMMVWMFGVLMRNVLDTASGNSEITSQFWRALYLNSLNFWEILILTCGITIIIHVFND
eukprot:Pgem_evm1s7166